VDPDFDLAIVGAGPAGAATALFASRAGMRVAVFDGATFPRDKLCGEGLMPPGRRALEELGLAAAVSSAGAPDLRGIEFGLTGMTTRRVEFPPHNAMHTGLGVRRLSFDAILADRIAADARIAFHPGTAVTRVLPRSDGGWPGLHIAAGEVRARHVVVADGLRSPLRRQLGWTIGPRPPHRYGVIAHWGADAPQDPWIRITVDAGLEIYEAPVGTAERLVAVLCHRRRMDAFGGRRLEAYRSIVQGCRPELARSTLTSEVSATGPFNYRARTVARDGIFLVGDAAGFTDPISAEGLAAAMTQARAVVASLDAPDPERVYRIAHRRLTRDPRRVSALFVLLTATPERAARGLRGVARYPGVMARLLGVNFGYWGFDRVSPREWLALFTGR
jgi:flavin-dependent dehydrogenase